MAAPRIERKLAAVLAADVVEFARLMERDERGTFERVKLHRKEAFEPLIAEHRGRIVKLAGDGALCEFPSIVDAVACAVLIQAMVPIASTSWIEATSPFVSAEDRARLVEGLTMAGLE